MRVLKNYLFILVLSVFIILAGCWDSDDDDDNGGTPSNGGTSSIYMGSDYYPLDVGNRWVYNLGTVEVVNETYTFTDGTGQRMSNWDLVCTEKDAFIAESEHGIVVCGFYHREDDQYYDIDYVGVQPPFVLLAKEMEVGDSWDLNSISGDFTLTFTFTGLETVTVPAGTFTDCLKIEFFLDEDPTTYFRGVYHYAKDVGIVKIERASESPPDYEGCMMVTSDQPLAELQSAFINGVSYP